VGAVYGRRQLWAFLLVICFLPYSGIAYAASVEIAGPGSTNYPHGGLAFLDDGALELSESAATLVLDLSNGYGYIGTMSFPGKVAKFTLGTGTNAPSLVGELTLNAGESRLVHSVIDTNSGYAYFLAYSNPARLIKVALGAGASLPTRIGTALFASSEYYVEDGFIDAENGYGWFCGIQDNTGSTGGIVKVDLGAGSSPPVRLGRLDLPPEEQSLFCGVSDSGFSNGYFGTYRYLYASDTTGRVVKVDLGSGTNLPVRKAVTVLTNVEERLGIAAFDGFKGEVFFGVDVAGDVVRMTAGEGSNAAELVSSTVLPASVRGYRACVFDERARALCIASAASPGSVSKVQVSGTSAPPTHAGVLWPGFVPSDVALDPQRSVAYLLSDGATNCLRRVALTHQSLIKGSLITLESGGSLTNVRFYSHCATGHVRVALYSNAAMPVLVWESDVVTNDADKAWINIATTQGTPSSLELQTGAYWLAWQIDTPLDVPGYVSAETNEGFQIAHEWGAFPGVLSGHRLTNQAWASAVDYTPLGGSLRVDLTGGGLGAQWRRTGQSLWLGGGTTEEDVPVGIHTVEFNTVSGWITPDDVAVTIVSDTLTVTNAEYVREAGSLSVSITGGGGDGRWRRTGESTWLGSAAIETNIPTGNYNVEFVDLEGWQTPSDQFITISAGSTTTTSAAYLPVGVLTALIEPSAVRSEGVRWSHDLFNWYTSGASRVVAEGDYTVSFSQLIGNRWQAPTSRVVHVAQGGTGETTGVYLPLGSLTVSLAGGDGSGRWRRVGQASWNSSGGVEHGIPEDIIWVEFQDVPLWVTPDTQSAAIVQGTTATVSAVYLPATRTVIFEADGTPGAFVSGVGTQTVYYGSNAQPVTAEAPIGRHFTNWTFEAALYSTNNPLTVTNVTEDMTLTAHFGTNEYLVAFETDGTPGATLTGAANQIVPYGGTTTPVTVDYPADAIFRRWALGAAVGPSFSTNNPVLVEGVVTDMTLVAKFALQLHVQADAAAGGDGRSWATAFQSLTNALSQAGAEDEIWVARGIYYPAAHALDRQAAFVLKDGVGVYGGFAGVETQRVDRNWFTNVTVLSGDLDRNDYVDGWGISWAATNLAGTNAFHVVVAEDVGDSTILDGFYITGGRADAPVGLDRNGGGLRVVSNTGPRLAHLTVAGNLAAGQGGGAYLEDCDPAVVNCAFRGNTANGGGGGIALLDAAAEFRNCLFAVNLGHFGGGGLYIAQSAPILMNCTIAGNQGSDGWVSGGFHADGGSAPSFLNCVIASNQVYEFTPTDNTAVVSYSLVQGGYEGTNNISQAPEFIGAVPSVWQRPQSGGDYRLHPDSVGVDAGTNLSWMSNADDPASLDLYGNPRIEQPGGRVDLGACEWPTGPVSVIDRSWLRVHGLAMDGTADYVDTDGDHRTNLEEWYALTDPTNAASVFEIDAIEWSLVGVDRFIAVECDSALTRSYYLLWRSSVASGAWQRIDGTTVAGDGGTITLTDTNAGPRRIYGIGIDK
jgi:hypothetical protein